VNLKHPNRKVSLPKFTKFIAILTVFCGRKVTVAFRYTTGELTEKKYRGAEGHFVRGFITKYYGVETEIVIYV